MNIDAITILNLDLNKYLEVTKNLDLSDTVKNLILNNKVMLDFLTTTEIVKDKYFVLSINKYKTNPNMQYLLLEMFSYLHKSSNDKEYIYDVNNLNYKNRIFDFSKGLYLYSLENEGKIDLLEKRLNNVNEFRNFLFPPGFTGVSFSEFLILNISLEKIYFEITLKEVDYKYNYMYRCIYDYVTEIGVTNKYNELPILFHYYDVISDHILEDGIKNTSGLEDIFDEIYNFESNYVLTKKYLKN